MRSDESHNENDRSPPSELIARLKKRDPAAWDRIVRRFGGLVCSWAIRFGLNREDAADIVQDVFLALLEHIAGVEQRGSGGNLLGWLKTVTNNKVRDHFRQHRVEPDAPGGSWAQRLLAAVPERPIAEDAPVGVSTPDDQDLEAVRLGRAQVEERTWQAFWRLAVDGQPADEVAAGVLVKGNAAGNALVNTFSSKVLNAMLLTDDLRSP